MSDSPIDLELRLLPDWLKEPAGKNPYANYEGETQQRSRRPYQGGPRSSGPSRNRPDRGGPRRDRQEGQGNRPPRAGTAGGGAPRSSQGQNRDQRRNPRPGGSNRPHSQQRGDKGAQKPTQEQNTQSGQEPVIPFQVDFLPEQDALAALFQQIKGGNRAFPLYGVGRMFLNRPERHRVKIASNAPAHPIFQIGEDGPLFLNRAQAEREAFRHARAEFYREETREIDAPKGNFTNVARCRISGVLLGPTNHHGYQLALRRLFEARFSRRMDFSEFQRQIEVVSAPEVVEEWKKEASSITLFHTTQEEEPKEFKTLQEVETHFKENYLCRVIKEGKSAEISGEASRKLNERRLRDAVREAWEKERGFPAQIVGQIRPHLGKEGLHVWKHRKRILFISNQRPSRFDTTGATISENIRAILETIEASPKATRSDLSQKILKPQEGTDEATLAPLKSALASDLHWLIQAGHVIEFHDGTLDLPLPPKPVATPDAPATEAPVENTAETTEPGTVEEAIDGAAAADTSEQATEASAAVPQPIEENAHGEATSVTPPDPVESEIQTDAPAPASETTPLVIAPQPASDSESTASASPEAATPSADVEDGAGAAIIEDTTSNQDDSSTTTGEPPSGEAAAPSDQAP